MDAARFKQEVCPCIDRMYGVALALTGSEADAADAVQDACVKLWERRDALDTVANIRAYACGAARNAAIDIIGRRRNSVDVGELSALPSADDTEYAYEQREWLDSVKAVARTLPESQRTVFAMREFGGCSLEEIGRATGFTQANVRVLLCRARNTVKKYFSKL